MKRKLFTSLLLAATLFTYAQEPCTFGPVSNTTANGENISTGGQYEYTAAADFDIPFATILTANRVTVNILKGSANLNYVNLAFLEEQEGIPGDVIQSFDALVPASQELLYAVEGENFDTYTITIDLPTPVVFPKGKYFLQISANPGDNVAASWEITNETQTYGSFDFFAFENDPWGGGGYYSKVFQVIGECADTGETQPNYGDTCTQQNASNNHQSGVQFIQDGQIVSIADDFVVPANTTFHLTEFNMHALMLGSLHNATIKIRRSTNFVPGEVLYTYTHKGPSFQTFDGYWQFPGSPFEVVSAHQGFTFEDESIELTAGTYFIEVIPTPYFSDLMAWETTSLPGIGGPSFTSYDGGTTWNTNMGVNQVFSVTGYCRETLGINTPQANKLIYYPNPVKDVLQITTDKTISSIAVYNIEGREIKGITFTNNAVNMQALASGIYVVKVQLDNGATDVIKVIKE